MTNSLKEKLLLEHLSGDFGKIQTKHSEDVINYAISRGFFEFDTVPIYGKGISEKILSKVCKKYNFLKVNTKCGYSLDLKKTFKPNDIIETTNKSVDLFGRINILYLHNPRKEIKNWNKVINLLNELKKQKIRYTGISLAHDFNYDEKIVNKFDCIQNEFNLLRPRSR